ncbi:hypothetical protein C900_01377 [Fulvivirga imtechensis AK7]|uniref:DUF1800 domain-containing protein n=1 Tax=Fulvivirga imtechensis AK7 TaxID=1237149 RepID=L8K2U4_9BACT|nr:DUF1800 family protein [Fulvivirga imtechensis]ELR73767.1 hypothetical protein C900_01377 [Fulvivirga imtechensis AK7]
MPLTALTGSLGVKRAAHLLRRATFGASKEQIDEFASLTASQAVAQLFATDLPDPPLPVDTATNQEWVISGAIEDVNSGDDELQEYFKRWFIGQMVATGVAADLKLSYSLREKITFFLHTHFTTMQEKVNDSRALYFQNALFRMFAFDKEDTEADIENEDTGIVETVTVPLNFKELTKKLCVDNAMLVFLDGRQNVKGSPNENYAREMFELYTIGRGLEGSLPPATGQGDYFNFTEKDVRAAANVLTGFDYDNTYTNIDPYTGLPRGRIKGGNIASSHENNSNLKKFSHRFDEVTIDADPALLMGGQPTEESVLDEISQLVEMIYSKEETARHICRKLYRFFVYYEITEELDNTIIDDMAATFTANNYKIQPVLEELFRSEHFYEALSGVDDDKFGGIIKSPLDLILGTLQFLEIDLPDYETNLEDFYMITGNLLTQMARQGLNFYEPFEVAGYVAYHQYPVYNRNWISTNYLTQRYNFMRELFSLTEGYPYINLLSYVRANFDGSAPDGKQLIIALAPYLYPFADNLDFEADGGDLTKERIRYFLQAFLQFTSYDDSADVDSTNAAWASLYSTPASYLEAGEYLRRLFNAMMQSPEYQLF